PAGRITSLGTAGLYNRSPAWPRSCLLHRRDVASAGLALDGASACRTSRAPHRTRSTVPTCPFDCTVDLLKFVRNPALMQHAAWREVMEWLARRIAELTKLSEVEVSYTTDRMVAGASLFSTVPRGQIGYGRLDVSHVPGELLKADEERGLIGKLWRELHR